VGALGRKQNTMMSREQKLDTALHLWHGDDS
ncbi:hypothetical protein CCACVL1_04916, partial [Corchorus capsularis]